MSGRDDAASSGSDDVVEALMEDVEKGASRLIHVNIQSISKLQAKHRAINSGLQHAPIPPTSPKYINPNRSRDMYAFMDLSPTMMVLVRTMVYHWMSLNF